MTRNDMQTYFQGFAFGALLLLGISVNSLHDKIDSKVVDDGVWATECVTGQTLLTRGNAAVWQLIDGKTVPCTLDVP